MLAGSRACLTELLDNESERERRKVKDTECSSEFINASYLL